MNKKFLSAILFGALMVTSTGTFVSCKDYDDDIDEINKELSDLKSQMAALQTEVSNGNWVTNLAPVDGGFTVTFKNGSSYTIVNGKDGVKGETGAAGKDGEGTTVEVKDGFWYLNGEKTEFVAVTEDELGKALVPYVEGGYWVFYDEEGKPQTSDYKAWGNAWAVNNSGVWTLHMPDAEGKDQAIELPTAAAKITGLEVLKLANASSMKFELASAEFKYDRNGKELVAKKDWGGVKAIPANESVVYTSATKYDMRLNPVDVDGKLLSYTLTNTKNGDVPHITLKATEQDEMFTTGNINSRAAQGNGLYRLSMDNFVLTKAQASAFNTAYAGIPANRVHAVNADHAFRSAYNITVGSTTAPDLKTVIVKDKTITLVEAKETVNNIKKFNNATAGTTGGAQITVDLNQTVKVGPFANEAALYDMFISIPAEYAAADVFNVAVDQAKRTIKVQRNPDSSTLEAWFPMYIYTVDINGNVEVANVKVVLSSKMTQSAYELITHNVSSNPNLFKIDLSTMYSNLGNDLNTWKINVDLENTDYALYGKYENNTVTNKINVNVDAFDEMVVKEVKANNEGNVADINDAKFIQVNVNNAKATYTDDNGNKASLQLGKTYYLAATFKNAANAEMNKIVVPVKFVAPSVADQFKVKDGYVKDNAINAYFYETEKDKDANKIVALNKYFSKYDKVSTVELGTANVGTTEKDSKTLAEWASNNGGFGVATLTLSDVMKGNTQYELGYGEALDVIATNGKYADTEWAYSNENDTKYAFKIRLMSPIEQGSVKPVNATTITINGNDLVNGAKITDAMIMGYDYNGNAYNVVPDNAATTSEAPDQTWWIDPQITDVTVKHDTDKYIKSLDRVKAKNTDNGKVNGYFVVKGESISKDVEVKMPVVVTDVWGYHKEEEISVTIKKN